MRFFSRANLTGKDIYGNFTIMVEKSYEDGWLSIRIDDSQEMDDEISFQVQEEEIIQLADYLKKTKNFSPAGD